MPTLTIVPSGKTAEVATGTTLLAAIASAGDTLKTHCTDAQCSGECHVFVPVGKKSLSKAQREENAKLDTIVGVGSKSRLACQARMGEEAVTVELLGFASG
ncbi:MAG TPA: 2Fe-2S iron-sulfur cluster-binding protein [Polyangiales bacterium]|nr:2Fe-2S iron-sulfur cluster-binding protein [Polyangiales bacterium]